MSDRYGLTDAQLARHNSAYAVCEAFGFPRADWPMLARWAVAPMSPRDEEALFQYVDLKIAERCWKPTDDLLSELIDFEQDGRELTAEEIYRFVATLLGASVF
ncbi:hypothetical protein [Mycolicibacterium phlei]|uniref:hypothetical protein n=1 Tax=Mycolicibacterium phlei TaxID=1771 RepID=UPI0037CC07CA